MNGARMSDLGSAWGKIVKDAAGKEIPDNVVGQLAKMTASNYHSEALVLLVGQLKDKKLLGAAEALLTLYKFFGSRSYTDDAYYRVYQQAMHKAKADLTPESFEAVRGAF